MSDNLGIKEDKYEKIIEVICSYKNIKREELFQILKDRESKYLMFLLMKKYKCADIERLHKDFFIGSKKSISYSLKKAEEKFFINRDFREKYFEAEDIVNRTG
ncbi:ribose-5-phosphate isomerase [Clostridium omnivorum]|uniref:Ribose-5-phosphate isomerase n=1 Tax=Clostridium omnivorum TaxID=1604902 RepID=A0ABQ5N2F0_9CLOT|nr:ribose-5-phosphate isomerase [Clostridium sp. E14]GLC29392.1 hypothetical protein bsdE14_08020 [Clostridium sp. E14]